MLLKIIGLCHTEGMGTVHDNVSRRMGDARMVFLMLTEYSVCTYYVTLVASRQLK